MSKSYSPMDEITNKLHRNSVEGGKIGYGLDVHEGSPGIKGAQV